MARVILHPYHPTPILGPMDVAGNDRLRHSSGAPRESDLAGPKRPVAAGATHMETGPRCSLPTSGRYSNSVSAGRTGKRPNGLARPSAAAPPAGAHWLRPIRDAAGPRVHRARSRPAFVSVALESTESMPSMLRASVRSTDASNAGFR